MSSHLNLTLFCQFWHSFSFYCALLLVGRISDIWGRKPVLVLSILGTCASYSLLLLVSESQAIFVISRVIVGLLKNTETSCYSIITDISTPALRVKRMAFVGGAIGLGFIVGPALSGILTSSHSLDTPAYISAIMLILNVIITMLLLPETKNLRSSKAPGSPQPSPHANGSDSSTSSTSNSHSTASHPHSASSYPHSSSSQSSLSFSSNSAPSSAMATSSLEEMVLNNSAEMMESLNDDMVDELAAPLDLVRTSNEFLRSSNPSIPPLNALSTSETTRRIFSSKSYPDENAVEDQKETKLSLWHLLVRPNPLRTLVWVYFGISMAIVIFQGSSVLLFQVLGVSVHTVSWIISYSGLLTVISSFVIQRLSSRYSEKQLLVQSILVVAVTLFATVFILNGGTSALVGLMVAYIPLILGARTLKNCLLGLVTQQTPPSQTGTIIGLLNSLESLCRALAPLIGGVLMQFFIGGPALAGSLICFGFLAYLSKTPFSQTGISTYESKAI